MSSQRISTARRLLVGWSGSSRDGCARLRRAGSNTPFAERSTARIAEIADKPPKPQQYVPWLVDLFPKRDKIQRLIDAVEDYEAQNPRGVGVVESEILPAAAEQAIGPP